MAGAGTGGSAQVAGMLPHGRRETGEGVRQAVNVPCAERFLQGERYGGIPVARVEAKHLDGAPDKLEDDGCLPGFCHLCQAEQDLVIPGHPEEFLPVISLVDAGTADTGGAVSQRQLGRGEGRELLQDGADGYDCGGDRPDLLLEIPEPHRLPAGESDEILVPVRTVKRGPAFDAALPAESPGDLFFASLLLPFLGLLADSALFYICRQPLFGFDGVGDLADKRSPVPFEGAGIEWVSEILVESRSQGKVGVPVRLGIPVLLQGGTDGVPNRAGGRPESGQDVRSVVHLLASFPVVILQRNTEGLEMTHCDDGRRYVVQGPARGTPADMTFPAMDGNLVSLVDAYPEGLPGRRNDNAVPGLADGDGRIGIPEQAGEVVDADKGAGFPGNSFRQRVTESDSGKLLHFVQGFNPMVKAGLEAVFGLIPCFQERFSHDSFVNHSISSLDRSYPKNST